VGKFEVVDATRKHITELWLNLSPKDEEEINAFGLRPRVAISRSFERSVICRAALLDLSVVCVWGLGGDILGDCGYIWMLTTPLIQKAKFSVIRHSRFELARALKFYPRVEGAVWTGHPQALRTYELMGMTVSRETSRLHGADVHLVYAEEAGYGA